jgi:DNA recombination protein RmuC
LFVVRTVEHLWRQEAQSKNAQDIARRGAELYDRLCGFTEELEKVGQRLDQAQTSFQSARTKLSGKQGAIQKAEQLRQLGVKPTKSLPRSLVESDANDDAEPTDTQALITFSSAA